MRRALASLVLLVVLAALAACDRPSAPPASGASSSRVALGDLRFVTLSPALGLMLQDLGLEDQIVGAHDYDSALARSIPRVGSLESIDYEALLRARPTHVLVEISDDRALPERLVALGEAQGWVLRRVRTLRTLDDIAETMDDLYLDYVSPPEAEAPGVLGFSDPGSRFEKTMPSEAFARSLGDRGPAVRRAGRVLLLGALSPPQAFGPGSFHAQVLERIGGISAIEGGGMWQELDAEDVVRLSPDAIVIISPRDEGEGDRFAPPPPLSAPELIERLGRVGTLDIPAIRRGRVALIDDPRSHIPAGSSMRALGDELASILERWGDEGEAGAP